MNIENSFYYPNEETKNYNISWYLYLAISLAITITIAGCWIAWDAAGIFSYYGIRMYDGSISIINIAWTIIPLVLVSLSIFIAYKLLRSLHRISKKKANILLIMLILIFGIFSIMPPGFFYTIPIFLSVMTLVYLGGTLFSKGKQLDDGSSRLNIWYKLITILLFIFLLIPSIIIAYVLLISGAFSGILTAFLVYVGLLIVAIFLFVLLFTFIQRRWGFTRKNIKIIWLYLLLIILLLDGIPFLYSSVQNIIYDRENVSNCKYLVIPSLKDECYHNKNLSEHPCGYIKNEELKEKCFRASFEFEDKNKIAYCNMLVDNSKDKRDCLYRATANVCMRIHSHKYYEDFDAYTDADKPLCFRDNTFGPGDTPGELQRECLKLDTDEAVKKCLLDTAKKNYNASMCYAAGLTRYELEECILDINGRICNLARVNGTITFCDTDLYLTAQQLKEYGDDSYEFYDQSKDCRDLDSEEERDRCFQTKLEYEDINKLIYCNEYTKDSVRRFCSYLQVKNICSTINQYEKQNGLEITRCSSAISNELRMESEDRYPEPAYQNDINKFNVLHDQMRVDRNNYLSELIQDEYNLPACRFINVYDEITEERMQDECSDGVKRSICKYAQSIEGINNDSFPAVKFCDSKELYLTSEQIKKYHALSKKDPILGMTPMLLNLKVPE